MAEYIQKFRKLLSQPVDPVNLGLFRVCFGLLMILYVLRYRTPEIMQTIYLSSDFHFSYPLFHWLNLPEPTAGLLAVVRGVIGLSGLLIAIGLFHRIASVALIGSFGYLFLLEQTYYNNHYYLVLLFAFLFIIVGADRFAALGSKFRKSDRSNYIPYWNVFVFQILLCLMFFFAGVAKINLDWLTGKVTGIIFKGADLWFIYFVAFMGLLIDLTLGPLLFWKPGRKLGIVSIIIFSIFVKYMLNIGIFPYLLIASTLLFIEPQSIRRFLNLYRNKERPLTYTPPAVQSVPGISTPVFALIVLFILIQVVVPLRHWVQPGAVNWSRMGDRFAWRMFSQENLGHIDFYITDLATGKTIEVPRLKGIDVPQYLYMAQVPDMIIAYAKYLRQHYENQGMHSPVVTVNSFVSQNGRAFSVFMNPLLNLGHESVNISTRDLVQPMDEGGQVAWIRPEDMGRFYSAEYQLAVIDQEGLIPGDHPYIAEIKALIDTLTMPKVISPYQVSNLVADVKTALYTEYGRDFSAKEILQTISRLFAGKDRLPNLNESIQLFI